MTNFCKRPREIAKEREEGKNINCNSPGKGSLTAFIVNVAVSVAVAVVVAL